MPASSSSTSPTVSSEFILGGAPLILRVSPRARRLRLRLDPRTGDLTLTVPRGVARRRALEWAAEHEDWAVAARETLAEPVVLGPGAQIPYRGALHRIEWATAGPRRVEQDEGVLRVGGPAETLEPRLLRWLKAQALAVLTAETEEMAGTAGVALAKVSVGDPVSRWGSCSSAGAIRYSWRLILAPDFVRRATVAHEVAHLVHMDHSPAFHAVARRLLGADPQPARAWLRREGAGLHRIGRSASAQ